MPLIAALSEPTSGGKARRMCISRDAGIGASEGGLLVYYIQISILLYIYIYTL